MYIKTICHKFPNNILIKIQAHLAVFDFEQASSKLLCSYQHVVCHRITAEQCLAIVWLVCLFILCQILTEVDDFAHLIQFISCVRICRKNSRHIGSTYFFLCCCHNICFQVINTSLTGTLNYDSLFLADCVIKRIYKRIKRIKLFAVIVCPHSERNRFG